MGQSEPRGLNSNETCPWWRQFTQGCLNKHQRTKSSPEQLGSVSPAEASRRLIASESMSELAGQPPRPGTRHSGIDLDDPTQGHRTPPGTPPPPYPAPSLADLSCSSLNEVSNWCFFLFSHDLLLLRAASWD